MIFEDQIGHKIELTDAPKRIISLVPSQTELLFDLKLADSIVGVTRFCVHPYPEVRDKTRIGGTKDFNFELIKSLKPDLIIANKEENYEEGILALQKDYNVWTSDIFTLEDAFAMISDLAEITQTTALGEVLIAGIKDGFQELKPVQPKIKCAYLIWRKPYMAAGAPTFINDMLDRMGLENVFAKEYLGRYPVVTFEDLKEAKLDVVLLSTEPYRFKFKHVDELKWGFSDTAVKLVDGELFSWYGSRLFHSANYFRQLQKDWNIV